MNEVELLLETYTKTVFEKDREAFLFLFDEKVRVFDMWGVWSYDGLAAWREMVAGWFASLGPDADRVSFEDVHISFGGDLATVTAFVRFAAVSPEGVELRFLYNRITLIIRRAPGGGGHSTPGGWKIIHQHTSAPVDGGTLNAMLER